MWLTFKFGLLFFALAHGCATALPVSEFPLVGRREYDELEARGDERGCGGFECKTRSRNPLAGRPKNAPSPLLLHHPYGASSQHRTQYFPRSDSQPLHQPQPVLSGNAPRNHECNRCTTMGLTTTCDRRRPCSNCKGQFQCLDRDSATVMAYYRQSMGSTGRRQGRPNKVAGRPEVAGRHNKVVGRPKNVAGRHNKVVGRPKNVAGMPKKASLSQSLPDADNNTPRIPYIPPQMAGREDGPHTPASNSQESQPPGLYSSSLLPQHSIHEAQSSNLASDPHSSLPQHNTHQPDQWDSSEAFPGSPSNYELAGSNFKLEEWLHID